MTGMVVGEAFNVLEKIFINKLNRSECNPQMLTFFDRYQESRRNWHKQETKWVLCDELFIENWDDEKKKQVIKNLTRCIDDGGCVLGVYYLQKLIGFASLHASPFGKNQQYAELEYIHISNGFRGQGIGKRLFDEICKEAREWGFEKLYISANPAEDSIAFYRRIGCTDASEISQTIQESNPFDYQLEYSL